MAGLFHFWPNGRCRFGYDWCIVPVLIIIFFLLISIIIKRTVKRNFRWRKSHVPSLLAYSSDFWCGRYFRKEMPIPFFKSLFSSYSSRSPFDTHKICSRNKHFPYRKHPHFSCTAWKKFLLLGLFIVALRYVSCPSPSVTSSRYCMIHSIFPIFLFFSLSTGKKYTLKDDSRFKSLWKTNLIWIDFCTGIE